MRKNKFIKLIEHILVALPLLMVLVTCCYTIWNSNANQSYYGETINEVIVEQASTELKQNVKYTTVFNSNVSVKTATGYYGNYVGILHLLETDFSVLSSSDIEKVYGFDFYDANTNYHNIRFYLMDNNTTTYKYAEYVSNNVPSNKFLKYIPQTDLSVTSVFANLTTYESYNNYSYLSSAFEYSLSEFNNMGFGKIDFVGFFVDMFHNGQSNVYIDFANSYLNYMLFIECTFVLPLVLYWFIHIGENILYKFEKGEW